MEYWICKVCGAERPDAAISVLQRDVTPEGLPQRTIMENVKFCNDREDCHQGASNLPVPNLEKFIVRDEEKFPSPERMKT